MTEQIPNNKSVFEIPAPETFLPDSVSYIEAEGQFTGEIGFYRLDPDGQPVAEVQSFTTSKGEPLDPFTYKKPHVEEDPFNPREEWEEKERANYYPVAIVRDAYRPPNHWHRADDAVACVVQTEEGNWETRYFPRQNISAETFAQAEELLTNDE